MKEQSRIESNEQKTPSDQIIESGIAQRMLDLFKKNGFRQNRRILVGTYGYRFHVESVKAPDTGEKITRVVMEKDGSYPIAFLVEEKGFGGSGPLTPKQFALVQKLAGQYQFEQ